MRIDALVKVIVHTGVYSFKPNKTSLRREVQSLEKLNLVRLEKQSDIVSIGDGINRNKLRFALVESGNLEAFGKALEDMLKKSFGERELYTHYELVEAKLFTSFYCNRGLEEIAAILQRTPEVIANRAQKLFFLYGFMTPLARPYLRKFSGERQLKFLAEAVHFCIARGISREGFEFAVEEADYLQGEIKASASKREDYWVQLRLGLAERYLLMGELDNAEAQVVALEKQLGHNLDCQYYLVHAKLGLAYLAGDFPRAEQMHALLPKLKKEKPVWVANTGFDTWIYWNYVLHTGKTKKDFGKILRAANVPTDYQPLLQIHKAACHKRLMDEDARHKALERSFREEHALFFSDYIYDYLRFAWADEMPDKSSLLAEVEYYEEYGVVGFAAWFAQLLCEAYPEEKKYEALNERLQQKVQFNIIPHQAINPEQKEDWEALLDGLLLLSEGKELSADVGRERLSWVFAADSLEAEVRLQKLGKTMKWSGGRKVAEDNLQEISNTVDLLPQDKAAILAVSAKTNDFYYGYYRRSTDGIELSAELLLALKDHPRLFLGSTKGEKVTVEVEEAYIQLINEKDGGKTLKLSHRFPDEDEVGTWSFDREDNVFRVVEYPRAVLELAKRIGKTGLRVPKKGAQKVIALTQQLSTSGSLQVAQQVKNKHKAIELEADSRPFVLLKPTNTGFLGEVYVRPLEGALYFRAGQGQREVFTEKNGKALKAIRSFSAEKKALEDLLESCPTLPEQAGESGFDLELEHCLQLLGELHEYGEHCVVQWPEGEALRLRPDLLLENLAVTVSSSGTDWFAVDGEWKVDNEMVLNLREILRQLEGQENFIKLDDGSFLRLSTNIQRKLARLRASLEDSGRKNARLQANIFGIADLEENLADIGKLKTDKTWQKRRKEIEDAQRLKPRVPTTLKATLRDYQKEGFQWMSRLAAWGGGACLADDMGLGKTLQALTVLLSRSNQGPSLVIAPASVCTNWQREVEKFAPTLNPIQYVGTDRQKFLEGLGKRDILICSYGILPYEEEGIVKIHWANIVLDEAQAIKNSQTKRAKIAYKLQGDFRVATTGTPIENHIGELWSIFNFINPGLLGTERKFISRFSGEGMREALAQIIRPFTLRRLKHQVLKELPEKTEITLTVTPSEEEKALYESLRQEAINKISSPEVAQASQSRMVVLAEITKLRQVACHPRMLFKDSTVASSKMRLVLETLEELLENGHKVLIFSQFVKHLALIREQLEVNKVSYQYLDGQTTKKKRAEAVDAFQGGEGEVFLISLKAGGTGLNLTAADYVMHLDPWWNPAAEDQASDRAHRIGQTRPVTIYRFVTEHTIEEKILRLHETKRELANELLAGTDSATKINTEELIALLQE